MFKKLFLVSIVSIFLGSCTSAAALKPAAIIATLNIDAEESYIYPDIVIDEDGTWREGISKDLFNKQTFTIFRGPNNETLSKVIQIEKKTEELPLLVTDTGKLKPGFRYWAFYSNKKVFRNKGIGEMIVPKQISLNIAKELKNGISKSTISKVVKNDLKMISNDFKYKINSNILQFSKGDLNGDKIQDYVVVLGKGYGLPGETIVAVIYVSEKQTYKRINLQPWTSNQDFFPTSFIFKDVNGDKAEELFVIESDSDCNYPIVYSWFGKGIQKVYAGNTQLWGGNF